MKNRVTKKVILEGARICKTKGYWSNELREFLEGFTNNASNKLNIILHSEYVSVNSNSEYHDLLLENGLLENVVNDSEVSSQEQQKADEQFVKSEYNKIKNKLSACTLETIVDSISSQNK